MAKSITQIQKDSDAKRGLKAKSYKLPITTIAHIEQLAGQLNVSQAQLITDAVRYYRHGLERTL